MFSIFFYMKVCSVFSLESPHQGDSNKNTQYTLMCLSIGTPKNNKFPFVPNGKFIICRCPKIYIDYSLIMMCLNTETPKNH